MKYRIRDETMEDGSHFVTVQCTCFWNGKESWATEAIS